MSLAPDALLGRLVTLKTGPTKWRIVALDASQDRIWFRSMQQRDGKRESSSLRWFWRTVGNGDLVIE